MNFNRMFKREDLLISGKKSCKRLLPLEAGSGYKSKMAAAASFRRAVTSAGHPMPTGAPASGSEFACGSCRLPPPPFGYFRTYSLLRCTSPLLILYDGCCYRLSLIDTLKGTPPYGDNYGQGRSLRNVCA